MQTSERPSRRVFLQSALAATAALAAPITRVSRATPPPGPPRATPRSIRLCAPIFDVPADPEQLALAHRQLGLRAAYCPAVELTDTPRIAEIGKAFAKHDVVIAEVGRWKNLLEVDPAQGEPEHAIRY